MPARNKTAKNETESKQTNKESALFPGGVNDPETKKAYDLMMKKYGSRAVEGRPPQGAVDMTPGQTPPAQPPHVQVPDPEPEIVVAPTPESEEAMKVFRNIPQRGHTSVSPVTSIQTTDRVQTVNVPVESARKSKMNEFVRAMNGISASSVYTVKMSDGRELSFEAPRVKTQKTLNQIIATNHNDPASQYIAQLGLLQAVCLTDGVDWNEISDFDRNKIMFSLYRDVMFRDEYKYRCDDKDCGFEWMGKVDGAKIIAKLDESDVADRIVKKKIDGIDYDIRIGFPKTKAMVAFLTDYGNRERDEHKSGEIDPVTLLEYIDLFIKEIWVKKDGEEIAHINLEDMFVPQGTLVVDENGEQVLDEFQNPQVVDVGECYREVVDVLGALPGALLQATSEDDVYTRISKLLIDVVNNAMPDCVCPKCGHRMGKAFGFNDFFSLG